MLLCFLIAVNRNAVILLSLAVKFGVNSFNPFSVRCVLFAGTKVVYSFSLYKKRGLAVTVGGVGWLLDSMCVSARFIK
jgi:hypothetical protein